MVFVGVLLGVAVLAGLAALAFRRRGSDEMHSVAGYQHRLERLEELRRRQSGSVRIVGGTTPNGQQEPVVGEDGRLEISSSAARRRVFEDTGQLAETHDRPAPATYRRRRDTSIARMSHRPRRLGAPIAAAVAVIVLVTGLAIAGAHSRGGQSGTTTTTLPKKHHVKKKTTVTTPTAPTSFAPTSTNGLDANYSLPFPSYTVTITATTSYSYVQITNSSGAVPYAQNLEQGTKEQLALSGNSEIQLGRPSDVTVEVDGTPVTFPTPLPAPLNLVLNSSAPASATTSTT